MESRGTFGVPIVLSRVAALLNRHAVLASIFVGVIALSLRLLLLLVNRHHNRRFRTSSAISSPHRPLLTDASPIQLLQCGSTLRRSTNYCIPRMLRSTRLATA